MTSASLLASVSSTLDALMSRCTTPLACMWHRPRSVPRTMLATVFSLSGAEPCLSFR